MHNNYYFLKQLVPLLKEQLKSAELAKCFSQNKDELILDFTLKKGKSFFIKAHLKSNLSCLSFPIKYQRAKKNSVDLFNSLINQTVKDVKLFSNERAFAIEFENHQLLFKLFGNQSNIVLFKNHVVSELFKNDLSKDKLITINKLDRKLDISFESLKENDWNIREVIPTLDKQNANILFNQLTNAEHKNKRSVFNEFMLALNTTKFYLLKTEKGYKLSLIKSDLPVDTFYNPIQAITSFFEKEIKYSTLFTLKSKILFGLKGQLTQSSNYLDKTSQKLKQLSTGTSNQQKADVLMANLHAVEKGLKTVELHNFYTESPIVIKLNPLQSPQKNAEKYYRKAKNEAKEISVLKNNIKEKEKVLISLNAKIDEINECNDIKLLLKQEPKQKNKGSEPVLPYKEFIFDDFKILVGKNAKHNDTLTLKIAKKDDLWLHAKDVSGSHVVIKQIPGKSVPKYIIEKAAQLAAHYSKRKTDSLCPVLYTPKKYVRKKKGTPAGAVFVEKEKVILVEPNNNI